MKIILGLINHQKHYNSWKHMWVWSCMREEHRSSKYWKGLAQRSTQAWPFVLRFRPLILAIFNPWTAWFPHILLVKVSILGTWYALRQSSSEFAPVGFRHSLSRYDDTTQFGQFVHVFMADIPFTNQLVSHDILLEKSLCSINVWWDQIKPGKKVTVKLMHLSVKP
jgi:hypothetical protein